MSNMAALFVPVTRWLEREAFGNSWLTWIVAATVVIGATIVLRAIKWFALARLDKRGTMPGTVAALVRHLLSNARLLTMFVVGIATASFFVDLPNDTTRLVRSICTVVFLLQCGVWASNVIVYIIAERLRDGPVDDPQRTTGAKMLEFGGYVVVWAIIALLILDNLGFNVSALVAGLGIGGVAVALATQNILADLFASISILLDKPFLVGDFIVTGQISGTVSEIGVKTTRIRSLSGEEIICSNRDLLESRVHNYKRMTERRVLFRLRVVYEASRHQLERVPEIIRTIVEATPNTRFDRAHFLGFGASSLDFEVVYFVTSAEYVVYMDAQQAINLALFSEFSAHDIAFAYPTQTVHVALPTRAADDDDVDTRRADVPRRR